MPIFVKALDDQIPNVIFSAAKAMLMPQAVKTVGQPKAFLFKSPQYGETVVPKLKNLESSLDPDVQATAKQVLALQVPLA